MKLEVRWFRLLYLTLLFICLSAAIPVQEFILSFIPIHPFEPVNIICFFAAYLLAVCIVVISSIVFVFLVVMEMLRGNFYFFKIVRSESKK